MDIINVENENTDEGFNDPTKEIVDVAKVNLIDIINQDNPPDTLEIFLLQIFQKRKGLQSQEQFSPEDIAYISDQLPKIEEYRLKQLDGDNEQTKGDTEHSIYGSLELFSYGWARDLHDSRKKSLASGNPTLLQEKENKLTDQIWKDILFGYEEELRNKIRK